MRSVVIESVIIMVFFTCWIYARVKAINTQIKIEEDFEKWNMEE